MLGPVAQHPTITFNNAIDTFIASGDPNGDYSSAPVLGVDLDDGAYGGGPTQALLRFDNIFGSSSGQVPQNSNIISALLKLNTTDSGNGASVYSMTVDWNDTDNWNFFGGNGIQPSIETQPTPDAAVSAPSVGITTVDVTTSLKTWQTLPSNNYGWAFLPSGTNGWGFHSGQGAVRPELTVTYKVDGDINSDGKVDFEDFAKIALFWNTHETSADIAPLGDGDGVIDILDLSVLCKNWLTGAE
jgi:hypothetical protein